jgi:copper resistance protein D
VAAFLDILEFLLLLLRAASFSALTLCAGGVLFLTIAAHDVPGDPADRSRRWIFRFALTLAALESVRVVLSSLVLTATTGASWGSLLGANYVQAGVLAAVAALAIALMMKSAKPVQFLALFAALLVLLAATVFTSHAAARLEHSAGLGFTTALHLAGSAIWMGGLPFLLIATRGLGDDKAIPLVRRFSRMAIIGVALLVGSGVILSIAYIGSWGALYGTAYGYMVTTKVVLFLLALLLGATNNRIIKSAAPRALSAIARLRPLSEAEIALGFTVILAAASLTSTPPAADLSEGRLTMAEIVDRFRPVMPRLESPPVQALSPASELPSFSSSAPVIQQATVNAAGDIAWSEYNHHWAGIIVGSMGILALLARNKHMQWAQYWPLMFVGLAVFIILRADPENWPLGPRGFWESFLVPDVAQHRFAALLAIAFAGFELYVRRGKLRSQLPALVFPLICSVGGALLLTHTHSLGNVKEELLAEMSHTPLAIAGVTAGWARWLELRLPGKTTIFGWIWPTSLLLVGIILVLYREA